MIKISDFFKKLIKSIRIEIKTNKKYYCEICAKDSSGSCVLCGKIHCNQHLILPQSHNCWGICNFIPCNKKPNRECKYCNGKYCGKHSFPAESHNCDSPKQKIRPEVTKESLRYV
tara:strand:- start:1283 stop:1627 length:345 start_codon:yes stop_codon:yes gene_type:complete